MRSHAPRSKRRLSIPVPRTLTALAEIATAIATGDSVGAVVPGVLSSVATQLDGTQATLWLRGLDGLRRAWSVAQDPTTAEAVAEQLALGSEQPGDGFVAARLLAGRQELARLPCAPGASSPARTPSSFRPSPTCSPPRCATPSMRTGSSRGRGAHRVRSNQRRFTEKIIDSLPVGIYVIDRSYRIQAWNRKRETGMQGVSREEAIGRTIFEILHRQPAEMLRREFDDVFTTGRIQQYPMESSATGELRTYRITKIPMHLDDSAVTHVITIGEDVTDWRKRQQRFAQAEKLAAIGKLAAGVMHEINNPLATIGACAESAVARRRTRAGVVQRGGGETNESLLAHPPRGPSLQADHRRPARLQPSEADDEDRWSTSTR